MNLSTKTYRWDVEETKDTHGNTIKHFTLYDWEVFGCVTVFKTDDDGNEKEYKFDKAYLETMVENARKEQDNNYFLPVHTKHKDKDSQGNMIWTNEPAGVAKGIKLGGLNGEPIIIVSEWTKIPEHIFNGILDYKWKYRSIEMNNYDNKRISSIAILDIEPPEFKLPITEVDVKDKEITTDDLPIPGEPVMATSFSEKDEMCLYFRETIKQINTKETKMSKPVKRQMTKDQDVKFAEDEKDKKKKDDKDILDEKDLDKEEIESVEKDDDSIKMGEEGYEEEEEETEDDLGDESDEDYEIEESDDFPEETEELGNDHEEPDGDEDDSELLTVVMEFTEKVAKVDAKMDTLIGLMSGKPAEQQAAPQQGMEQQATSPMPMQMSEQQNDYIKMGERQKDAIAFMELRDKVEKSGFKFAELENQNMYQDVRPFSREAIEIIASHEGSKSELANKIIKMAENHIGFDEYHGDDVPASALLSFEEQQAQDVSTRIPKEMKQIPNIVKMRIDFEQLHPEMKFQEDDKAKKIFAEHVKHTVNINKK